MSNSQLLERFMKEPCEEGPLPTMDAVFSYLVRPVLCSQEVVRYLDRRPKLLAGMISVVSLLTTGPYPATPNASPAGPDTTIPAPPCTPGVNPVFAAGQRAFERDLPRLLAEGHSEREWAAYHGDRLLGIAPDDMELHEKWCIQEKLDEAEVFFHTLRPDVRRAYLL